MPLLFILIMAFASVHFSLAYFTSVTQEVIAIALSFIFYLIGTKLQMVGLTGGIACGKSTISSILVQEGKMKMIDCDLIAHQVLTYNSVKQKLRTLFGEEVFDHIGEVDRTKLGPLVFKDA